MAPSIIWVNAWLSAQWIPTTKTLIIILVCLAYLLVLNAYLWINASPVQQDLLIYL